MVDGPANGSMRPRPEATLLRGGPGVSCLSYSPRGDRLAAGFLDQSARVFELPSGRQALAFLGHGGDGGAWRYVYSVAFSPDGGRVASGDGDHYHERSGTACVWDARTGAEELRLAHREAVNTIAWSPDGAALACGVEYGIVVVWDARRGGELRTLRAGAGVASVAWSGRGGRLAAALDSGAVVVWDGGGAGPGTRLSGHGRAATGVAWTGDGTRLVSVGHDGCVRLWDPGRGEEVGCHRVAEGRPGTFLTSVACSADGRRVAAGGHDGRIHLLDLAGDGATTTVSAHGPPVESVAFDPGSARLASAAGSAHGSGEIAIWTVEG